MLNGSCHTKTEYIFLFLSDVNWKIKRHGFAKTLCLFINDVMKHCYIQKKKRFYAAKQVPESLY